MENLNLADLWPAILAAASAIVLLANASEKIAKAVQAARAPGAEQDKRLSDLEDWKKSVDTKLDTDKKRLDAIDQGNRATQRALLALLDHGIDGNNIEQMQHAKEELQNHLINR